MANILIFDSGVGGLSIAAAIYEHLPSHRIVFASDNAAYPYGTKKEHELVPRVLEVVRKLIESKPIDIVVIACNTASTVALPELRKQLSIDVVGVVPAIKPAAKNTLNKHIGVLATPATVDRPYTSDLVNSFASGCQIDMLGSSELVDLAEQKLHDGQVSLTQIEAIVEPWLELECKIDTIVLACTHFPLLQPELATVFTDHGRHINWVDSSEGIARRVGFLLAKGNQTQPSLDRLLLSNSAVFTTNVNISQTFQTYLDQLGIIEVSTVSV